MVSAFLTWLSHVSEVVFPRECLICGRSLKGAIICFRCAPAPFSQGTTRCPQCFGAFPHAERTCHERCPTCVTFPLPTRRIRYLWEYADKPRDIIRAMKYQPSVSLTRHCAFLLVESLTILFDDTIWDVIVPVPSSPKMVRKRLFHPCQEIAKVLARSLPSATLSSHLLYAPRRSPQATRTHDERLRGLSAFFKVRDPHKLRGKRVLLVEDVMTTGATIAAAAHALREAGALHVDVIALAQAQVWTRFRMRIYRIFNQSLDSSA